MKERFLNLAASCALATMTFATPAALAADDCCYQQPDNCYAGCNYCDEQCISVFADYLYWNVCPSSLSFATEARSLPVTATAPSSGTPFTSNDTFSLVDPVNSLGGSKDHHVNTKYKSGFRIGFAYHMPDQWDLEVAYTYFHPTYKGHQRTCGDSHFVPCGLPAVDLSLPINLALQVPSQTFSLAECSSSSPFNAVNFITSSELIAGPALSNLSGPVTGCLTGSPVNPIELPGNPTFPFHPEDLTANGTLRPLQVTGTQNGSRFLLTIPSTAFDFAKIKATLKYDLVDILFAKRYDCGGCFDYVPYVGARILSLEEDIHTHLGITVTTSDSASNNCGCTSENAVLSVRNKLKLPAAGLTFGSRMNYAVCDCFNLFGNIGASILGGNAKQSTKWDNYALNQALAGIALPPNFTISSNDAVSSFQWDVTSNVCPTHRHRSHCQVVFGLDASLGIGYEWCLCSVPVLIGAGYEIQSWWNMPQHLTPQVCGGNGNSSFTVHGLFVRLGFGF